MLTCPCSPIFSSQAVYTFSTITFDATLPVAVHTTCIRLLLNLVECIYPLARSTTADVGAKIKGRQLLSRILECLVTKVKHLKLQVCKISRGQNSMGGCLDIQGGAVNDLKCLRCCCCTYQRFIVLMPDPDAIPCVSAALSCRRLSC